MREMAIEGSEIHWSEIDGENNTGSRIVAANLVLCAWLAL